jgi:Protein of unknown function (DUF732)
MRGMITASALTTIGLLFAAPAGASPVDDYLGVLSNTPGFTVNGFTGPLLINAGNGACTDLRAGISPEEASNRLMWYPGATNAAMRAMVAAAQQTLCPETR